MIKLISKRRLAFRNPEDGSFATVLPQAFESVPDWAAKDPIFKWGLEDGTIQTVDKTIVSADSPVKAPKRVEKEAVEEKAVEPKKPGRKKK